MTADDRLARSPGLDASALARLQMADGAVIGVGLLGWAVAVHLGLLGVGLVLIDVGTVEACNLANQALPASSVGEPKSTVRARQIAELNPDCVVRPICRGIEDLGLAALAGADLLVSGLDGRAARARVNEVAWALGVPFLDTAVDGSGRWLRGTVTYYDPRRLESPCFLCSLDRRVIVAIAREGRGPGCPSWRRPGVVATPPTLQASAIGGVVAGFAAMWATRVLLGRADDLVGRQLVIECDREPRVRLVTRTRSGHCLFAHRRLDPLVPARGETIGELLAAAAADLGTEPDRLELHGRSLVMGLVCACGARRQLVRVTEACTDDDVRCECGREMAPAAISERLTTEEARRCASLSWPELGLPVADVVTAAAGERAVHYVVNERPIG